MGEPLQRKAVRTRRGYQAVRADVRSKPELLARLPELEDKILACWGKPKACHGDVLLQLIEERCGL